EQRSRLRLTGKMEHGRRRTTQHSHRRLLEILVFCITSLALEITPAIAQDDARPRLSSAVIRGVTVYEPAALFPLYRDHLGKPIERERVSSIVTALADRYQADGHPRPRITLDDELTSLGIIRINVFEPQISTVEIRGDAGPHREEIE